jgi:hypothetical protein
MAGEQFPLIPFAKAHFADAVIEAGIEVVHGDAS